VKLDANSNILLIVVFSWGKATLYQLYFGCGGCQVFGINCLILINISFWLSKKKQCALFVTIFSAAVTMCLDLEASAAIAPSS
jgi:hypothetical protein